MAEDGQRITESATYPDPIVVRFANDRNFLQFSESTLQSFLVDSFELPDNGKSLCRFQ